MKKCDKVFKIIGKTVAIVAGLAVGAIAVLCILVATESDPIEELDDYFYKGKGETEEE